MALLFLNHLSINNQYNDEEDFLESLLSAIQCLELAQKKNCFLRYSKELYNTKVHNDILYRSIVNKHPSQDAEIQRFKRLLQQLEPEEDVFVTNSILDETLENDGILLSFRKSALFQKLSYDHNGKPIKNCVERTHLVKHLFDLKEIYYPTLASCKYIIHTEKDHAKHGDAHFHIEKGGKSVTVLIRNFESASKTTIPRDFLEAIEKAKEKKNDLIEIWNFFNSDKPYNPN